MEMTSLFTLCVSFLVIQHTGCQHHGGTHVSCYECASGSNSHCLTDPSRVRTCASDEKCNFAYGTKGSNNEGFIMSTCARDCNYGATPNAQCPYGGADPLANLLGNSFCYACCDTRACVEDLRQKFITHPLNVDDSSHVVCPGQCDVENQDECLARATNCKDGQFCHVSVLQGQWIIGTCQESSSYKTCQATLSMYPCDDNYVYGQQSVCQLDCCLTNECLAKHFTAYNKFTPTPTTTPMPTTTPAPTTPSYLQKFGNSCYDHLEPGACLDFHITRNICQDKVSIELCPETCGICKVIEEANCHDTALNNECQDLVTSRDICHEATAKYLCPKTCGICDDLINAAVQDILDGKVKPVVDGATTSLPAVSTTTQSPQTSKTDSVMTTTMFEESA